MSRDRTDLDSAKDRVRIPELWRILNLPGEPVTRDGVKFSSHSGRMLTRAVRFTMDADGCSIGAPAKTTMLSISLVKRLAYKMARLFAGSLISQMDMKLLLSLRLSSAQKRKQKRADPIFHGCVKRRAPRFSRSQTAEESIITQSSSLKISDTLRVGEVCMFMSWVLLDSSGLCAEGRRLNRKPYPAIATKTGQLDERKAHTLGGSQKNWPVGILPAKEYRGGADALMLVEGGPDYLAALHFALAQKRTGILPIAILGRGQARRSLHPESLEHFRGRRIRILPHDDPDGGSYQSALAWFRQLRKLDCEIDFFTFEDLRKTDGTPVKDLNDCTQLASSDAAELGALFP